MSGGTILGRSPALWVALIAAAINVGVGVFGLPLTVDQITELNALALAAIAIVANASQPGTVPTFALTTRAPNPDSTSSTDGSNGPTASQLSAIGAPTGDGASGPATPAPSDAAEPTAADPATADVPAPDPAIADPAMTDSPSAG